MAHITDDIITLGEIEEALNKIKNGEATSRYKITGEMLIAIPDELKEGLKEIMNRVLLGDEAPEDRKMRIIIPSIRKGTKRKAETAEA